MEDRRKLCVIGIGNPDCGDDRAGHEVLDLLKIAHMEDTQAIKLSGEVSGLIEALSRNSVVILIDAIDTVSKPGKIHRFDAGESPLPSEYFSNYSTHSMGVNEAIELARVLGELPERLIVYGIEGVNFEAGESMCPEVQKSLTELAKTIHSEISTFRSETEPTSN